LWAIQPTDTVAVSGMQLDEAAGVPGRMYLLEVDGAQEWLRPMRQLCATPDRRNALRALLRQRRLQT
jgi:hypothetical protein